MRYYLNDASIQNQFDDEPDKLFKTLVELAILRIRFLREIGELFIAETLREKKVINNESLINSIRKFAVDDSNKDDKTILLRWIESARARDYDHVLINPDEKFFIDNMDLNRSALSLASKQIFGGTPCTAFSIEGGEVDFCYTPLIVEQFNSKGFVTKSEITNFWETDEFEIDLLAKDQINSWESMIEFSKKHYRNLEFSNFFANSKKLGKGNFSNSACSKTLRMFKILNDYVENCDENGMESPNAIELKNVYFWGNSDLFSDESPSNIGTLCCT